LAGIAASDEMAAGPKAGRREREAATGGCRRVAPRTLVDIDLRPRLRGFLRLGQEHGQHALVETGLHRRAIDRARQRQGPLEGPVAALGEVVALLPFLALFPLLALDGEHVVGERQLDILRVHAWQLGGHAEFVVGLDHVERGGGGAEGALEQARQAGLARGAEAAPEVVEQAVHRAAQRRPRQRCRLRAARRRAGRGLRGRGTALTQGTAPSLPISE
jgi:hypothetical protein